MAFDFFNDMLDKIKDLFNSNDESHGKLAPGATRRLSSSSNQSADSSKRMPGSAMGSANSTKSASNTTNTPNKYNGCGIPKLDALLDPSYEGLGKVIFLKTKNPKVDQFIENYKKEALKFGKVFQNTFGKYPTTEEENAVYAHFEDLHILRIDDYSLGIAGWLPQIKLEYTGYIARKAHGILFEAASAYANEQGLDSNSIDVSPVHAIVATWMKASTEIFENVPRISKVKHAQRIYYKGSLKRVSIYYFIFLTAMGCDVLVDLNNQTEPLEWISSLPENMRVVDIV